MWEEIKHGTGDCGLRTRHGNRTVGTENRFLLRYLPGVDHEGSCVNGLSKTVIGIFLWIVLVVFASIGHGLLSALPFMKKKQQTSNAMFTGRSSAALLQGYFDSGLFYE